MTPLEYYHQKCEEGLIFEDPEQLAALQALQWTYKALVTEHKRRSSILAFLRKPKLVNGVYLWGGVGIGKTFLMDCFYNALPFPNKVRMHFYQFMQSTHNELAKLQGSKNPLQKIAKQWAAETTVLCFDEFFVSDITDAMLVGKLLSALFFNGVTLVATSNITPDDLYKNGIQREQFLPAIELIKKDTQVVYIATKIDYRLRHLKEAGVFYTPLDELARQNMEKTFEILTRGQRIITAPIDIYGRSINVRKRTEKVIWFEFQDICSVPRCQKDYLAIAKEFETVFVSNIPVIDPHDRDKICLFISLIDVFYDARVRLVFSAAESVEKLYSRGHLISEYTRTNSRLLEMQSTDYFTGEYGHRG